MISAIRFLLEETSAPYNMVHILHVPVDLEQDCTDHFYYTKNDQTWFEW